MCTQAESSPQQPLLAGSEKSSELANNIAQANLQQVVVVQSSCGKMVDGLASTVQMKTKYSRSPVQIKMQLFETNLHSKTEGGGPQKAPQNIKKRKVWQAKAQARTPIIVGGWGKIQMKVKILNKG